jgi:hypothetical protein
MGRSLLRNKNSNFLWGGLITTEQFKLLKLSQGTPQKLAEEPEARNQNNLVYLS